MYDKLGDVPLRAGDNMEIYLVKTPDNYYRDRVLAFLGHKGEIWQWHTDLSFRGELGELETRFYIGSMGDRIIGNVSTWEQGPLGILGHVFTAKDQRRKGVFKSLLAACIQDFRRRGGKILILGTPTDAPWNHVYKGFGFRSITEGSEVMRYDVDPNFERSYFQSGKLHCREPEWKDWPAVSVLYSVQGGWYVRSVNYSIFGPFDYEDKFLYDTKKIRKGKCQARVLLTERESVVGYATLTPDDRWDRKIWLLDFFLHPLSKSHAVSLLKTMLWPEEKVQCYVEADAHEKIAALSAQGFQKEAVFSKQVMQEGKAIDILVMERLL